ncbi:MAG: heparinase II/III family protein [Maricaulaceae bacterium]
MAGGPSPFAVIGAIAAAGAQAARDEWRGLPLYRWLRLNGPPGAPPTFAPTDLHRGDSHTAAEILSGRLRLAGETLDYGAEGDPWRRPSPSRRFAETAHRFFWLRDLAEASDQDAAKAEAGRLIDIWIEVFGAWNRFAWSPDLAGDRINNLIAQRALWVDAPEATVRRRASALGRQIRHLRATAAEASPGPPRFRAACALTVAGAAVPGAESGLDAGLRLLERELDRQILLDGGHSSRSPLSAADALCELHRVLDALNQKNHPAPEALTRARDRLAPMVRFLRHADGRLTCFNGGGEGDKRALSRLVKSVKTAPKPFTVAPHTGYQRVQAGGLTLILDVGEPGEGAASVEAHAGALAFELATKDGRLIVNCGWAPDQPRHWRDVVRATAAHSTLVLNDTSSLGVLPEGLRRRWLGARVIRGPGPITVKRSDEERGAWIEASHQGYRRRYGLVHGRRIFVASDGADVRGEDTLTRLVDDGPAKSQEPIPYQIRFHLHPAVRASRARDGRSVLLAAPWGEGWRFRADLAPVEIEASAYLGLGAPPQRSTQLVLNAVAEPGGRGDKPPNRVRWALQKMDRSAPGALA